MTNRFDEEFHRPRDEESVREPGMTSEAATNMNLEFSGLPAASPAEKAAPEEKREARHRRIKRQLLLPAVSVLAVFSVVFAAFRFDPLGRDYLSAGPSSEFSGGDEGFPSLSNLRPDFEGAYAWSGQGSEQYIRILPAGGSTVYTWLEMGSAWAAFGGYDENGQFVPNQVSELEGARYDAASNTLTLENFTASVLDVNLMGNGFTLRLIGENHLEQIIIWGAGYGGSLTVTGSGSLAVNQGGGASGSPGIQINGEWSQSCLMVDREVTLDVYGSPAILIGATTMAQAVYYRKPSVLTGGVPASGEFVSYSMPQYDEAGNYLGNVPVTLAEISQKEGRTYYDYSVVDEEGNPVSHVHFGPAS